MKVTILLGLLLGLSIASKAQVPIYQTSNISWGVSCERVSGTNLCTYKVKLKAYIPPSSHMFSQAQPANSKSVATIFSVEHDKDVIVQIGKFEECNFSLANHGFAVCYKDSATFYKLIIAPREAKSITVSITYDEFDFGVTETKSFTVNLQKDVTKNIHRVY